MHCLNTWFVFLFKKENTILQYLKKKKPLLDRYYDTNFIKFNSKHIVYLKYHNIHACKQTKLLIYDVTFLYFYKILDETFSVYSRGKTNY